MKKKKLTILIISSAIASVLLALAAIVPVNTKTITCNGYAPATRYSILQGEAGKYDNLERTINEGDPYVAVGCVDNEPVRYALYLI